jgi:hypothetical protein
MNCGVASVEREAAVVREASPLCFPDEGHANREGSSARALQAALPVSGAGRVASPRRPLLGPGDDGAIQIQSPGLFCYPPRRIQDVQTPWRVASNGSCLASRSLGPGKAVASERLPYCAA